MLFMLANLPTDRVSEGILVLHGPQRGKTRLGHHGSDGSYCSVSGRPQLPVADSGDVLTYMALLRLWLTWDPLCYVNASLPSRRGSLVSPCYQSSYATFENES